MKKFIIPIIQFCTFYLLPLLANKITELFAVSLITIITLILSLLFSKSINTKLKYLYPLFVVIIFIPSIYIHYNESALIHSLWYFFISLIGIFIGS